MSSASARGAQPPRLCQRCGRPAGFEPTSHSVRHPLAGATRATAQALAPASSPAIHPQPRLSRFTLAAASPASHCPPHVAPGRARHASNAGRASARAAPRGSGFIPSGRGALWAAGELSPAPSAAHSPLPRPSHSSPHSHSSLVPQSPETAATSHERRVFAVIVADIVRHHVQGVRVNVCTLLADLGQVKSGVCTQEEVFTH